MSETTNYKFLTDTGLAQYHDLLQTYLSQHYAGKCSIVPDNDNYKIQTIAPDGTVLYEEQLPDLGGRIIVTGDVVNIKYKDKKSKNYTFDLDNMTKTPAEIWDLVVNQQKNLVLLCNLRSEIEADVNTFQYLTPTSGYNIDVSGEMPQKAIMFENCNIAFGFQFATMNVQIYLIDGEWTVKGITQYDTGGKIVTPDYMTNVTWSELKSQRDAGKLITGMQYRITDYTCTTSQEGTHSAGNDFDIIVTADDYHTLNENARACSRDWSSYFTNNFAFEYTDDTEQYLSVSSTLFGTLHKERLKFNYNGLHSALDGYKLYGNTDQLLLVPTDGILRSDYIYIGDGDNIGVDGGVPSTDTTIYQSCFDDYSDIVHHFDGSNLSAWELKYCLDNDNGRFAWAASNFSVNGKGVIYYMKDEFGNELPYDFKNILFEHEYEGNIENFYTFTNIVNGAFRDGSLNIQGSGADVKFNIMLTKTKAYQYELPQNIFYNDNYIAVIFNVFDNDCHHNVFTGGIYYNKFNPGCYGNKFYTLISSTFGSNCQNIDSLSTHRSIYNCTFGDDCEGIVPVNTDLSNVIFRNFCKDLAINTDNILSLPTSNGWVFDANTYIKDYTVNITLPNSANLYDYTGHKRVTKTSSDKIIAIQEYLDGNYAIQNDITLLYPSVGGRTITYNSDEEITGDWVDENTDTTQNTYDEETGDGVLYLNDGVDTIGGVVTRAGLRETIINSPFYQNTHVRSVDMSQSGLLEISNDAFNDCRNLSNVVIPDTVKKIGVSAFKFCTIMSVDIPNSVTTIDSTAFTSTININYTGSASGSPWGAKYVNAPTDKDSGLMFGEFNDNKDCSVIGCIVTGKDANVVIIPDKYNDGKYDYNVTAIGQNAFRNCTNITSVTIPESVTTLGSYLFEGCYKMDGKDKVSTIQSVTELSSFVPTTEKYTFSPEIEIPYLFVLTDEDRKTYSEAGWNAYFKEIATQKKSVESGSEER